MRMRFVYLAFNRVRARSLFCLIFIARKSKLHVGHLRRDGRGRGGVVRPPIVRCTFDRARLELQFMLGHKTQHELQPLYLSPSPIPPPPFPAPHPAEGHKLIRVFYQF